MVQSEPVEEVCMVGWSRGCMETGVMLEKWVGAVRQQDDYKVTWLFLLITTLRQQNRLGPLQLCTTCNKFLFENSRPACDDGKFIIL